MICKKCGSSMVRTGGGGDGWIEPIEEYYTCPKCGEEYEYNQAYGSFWSSDDEEEDIDD